jgi:membrane-bound lytic murein transglycosylase F
MLAAIVLGALLSTCSSPPSILERILRSGELRVVTRNTPAAFYYGADEPRGIEYELARGYAEKLGVSLRIYIDDQVFSDLASGKAQIGAASLTVSDARRASVTFGPGYQAIEPLIIYRRGTPRPRKLADLVGGRLDVVARSSHAALLEELRQQEPLLTWVEHTERSSDELIRRVAEGEIDYTVADSNLFELLRQFYPDLRVAFPLGPTDHIVWALPKGDEELRESVASYFAEIEATGELKQILDRYYFASREFDYVGSRAFMRHVDTRLARYRDFFLKTERSTGIDWRLIAASRIKSHWDPEAIADGRAQHDDADGTHGGHGGGRRPATRVHSGGANAFCARARQGARAHPRARPLWLAVASHNLGFGHLEDARVSHTISRRGSRPVGRGPRALAVVERQSLVQPRAARVRPGTNRGHVRRERAPLLRDPHVARQPRDADLARVRAAERPRSRGLGRVAAAPRREELLQQRSALLRQHAA